MAGAAAVVTSSVCLTGLTSCTVEVTLCALSTRKYDIRLCI